HLMTHAFFKALLFLAAGSVIMGMHHDQDIRNMGGLRKYMKITYWTSLIGSLALIGTPFFSGFYSKDSIIEAAHSSHLPGAGFALFSVTAGVFVTAFYSFRMFFLVFHGKERFHDKPFPPEVDGPEPELEEDDSHGAHGHAAAHAAHAHDDHAHGAHDAHDAHGHGDHGHGDHDHTPHESPWVVTGPLIALAIPSAVIGAWTIKYMLYGGFFGSSIFYNTEKHPEMEELAHEFHGATEMGIHAFTSLPFWLAAFGVAISYWFYIVNPAIPKAIGRALAPLIKILDNKYYFDWFNENVLAAGARLLGRGLWKGGDQGLIDGLFVNGSARAVGAFAGVVRLVQTGHLYWYALVMILGVFGLLTWQLWPYLLSVAH
ncbi:MAG: proton-conducting transporter membrane subunit, partial [Betaproteobacteria bacterium]